MRKLHLTATVSEDRKLVVMLPQDVAPGLVEIDLTIRESSVGLNGASGDDTKAEEPYFCLADWFEGQSEYWGDRIRSDDVEGFTGRRF